jgi:hypothetical protein
MAILTHGFLLEIEVGMDDNKSMVAKSMDHEQETRGHEVCNLNSMGPEGE